MRERYNLDQIMKEIEDDEQMAPNGNQQLSQDDIKKMLTEKGEKKRKTT